MDRDTQRGELEEEEEKKARENKERKKSLQIQRCMLLPVG